MAITRWQPFEQMNMMQHDMNRPLSNSEAMKDWSGL